MIIHIPAATKRLLNQCLLFCVGVQLKFVCSFYNCYLLSFAPYIPMPEGRGFTAHFGKKADLPETGKSALLQFVNLSRGLESMLQYKSKESLI